ncbi:MAG: DUF3883 domain-containing protein, partial [Acidimicrobiales bacterium]|nr:DUF3883 domain-containing protein [Acidimicrobiales bacterium]
LRLLDKLEQQRAALGGEVFDVLGDAFRDRPLRELLLEAIRYGDRPDVRAKLDEVIDASVGEGLAELVAQHALYSDVLSVGDVERARLEMEEANARRLQPHYVRAFFLEAFRLLGGQARERESGRYELTRVPAELRARDRVIGAGAPVLPRYERVVFDKSLVRVPGAPPAELIAPGHPLLDVVIDLVIERHRGLLTQGAVLVDATDDRLEPRVLVYLEHAIRDGRMDRHGHPRVVSRRFEFVTVDATGDASPAGPAPYLDLRPLAEEERALVADVLDAAWLSGDIEAVGMNVAIQQSVPEHLATVRALTMARTGKTRKAVRDRLTKEIYYWDQRAAELREQFEAGRQPKMNPDRAQQRANQLEERLRRRLAELDQEETLSALPPVVVGAALVIPAGRLAARRGEEPVDVGERARRTEEIERRAIDAVMHAERMLGREPTEMPHNNPGFDIRSVTPDGHYVFIEVKGRLRGAEKVNVTRSEILFGLNAAKQHRLALVEVDPDGGETVRYLTNAFAGMEGRVHFAETAVTFDWHKLWEHGTEPC